MVVYVPTMVVTGNGESGFDSGEREPEKRLPLLRKAAGAQITHSRYEEVVTKNTKPRLIEFRHWNENNPNLLTRI